MAVTATAMSTISPSALALNANAAHPQAATFFFKPGMKLKGTVPGGIVKCTGGYVIRGASGTFPTTAGHCFPVNTSVWAGTVSPPSGQTIGTIQYRKFPRFDTELITESPGNDTYQIVVDPLTGRMPSPSGKVTGYYTDFQLTDGLLVGKMGEKTGWTEGRIVGYYNDPYGFSEYCDTAAVDHGDSGGPVWRSEPDGVKAIGITLSKVPAPGGGYWHCFASIADVLYFWGATLPVWSGPSSRAPLMLPAPVTRPAPPVGLRQLQVDPSSVIPL